MTLGVGGSTADQEMAGLSRQTGFIPISPDERQGRIANAQRLMVEQGIDEGPCRMTRCWMHHHARGFVHR